MTYHRHYIAIGGTVLYVVWTAVFASGMACGAAFVGLLVVRRPFEPLLGLATLACVGVSAWAILSTMDYYSDPGAAIIAGTVSLAAGAGGFGLASALLEQGLKTRADGPRSLDPPAATAPGTAVLLLACIESESYSPRRVAADLADLASAGLREPGLAITPFLYTAQKARYRAMGGTSPSAGMARELVLRLDALLEDDARFSHVELVECSAPSALARAVERLVARGHTHFIGATLSIGESYELDRAKSSLAALRPHASGIQVEYTPALCGSEALAVELVGRILTSAVLPADTGVALVMHGQAASRQRTHSDFDIQEDAFCNRIRMLLGEGGVPDRNVRLCYHDWDSPDVTETVRHLAAVDCKHVVVAPACFPLGGTVTALDLPVAVHQARVDEHISTVTLPAWGDEDVVARVLKDELLALDSARERAERRD